MQLASRLAILLGSAALICGTGGRPGASDPASSAQVESVVSVIVQGQDLSTVINAVDSVGATLTHELGIIAAVGARVNTSQRAALETTVGIRLFEDRTANIATADSVSLIEAGANWKYLDDGSNQGQAWAHPGFNDATWASGPGELGYGDGDEATIVGYGGNASDKHVTTYFRHTFSVADAASFSSLVLRLRRDDGGVAYLNGTEIFRSNMPSGSHHPQHPFLRRRQRHLLSRLHAGPATPGRW